MPDGKTAVSSHITVESFQKMIGTDTLDLLKGSRTSFGTGKFLDTYESFGPDVASFSPPLTCIHTLYTTPMYLPLRSANPNADLIAALPVGNTMYLSFRVYKTSVN